MAADLAYTASRTESNIGSEHPRLVLVLLNGRTAWRRGDPSSCATPVAAPGKRARRAVWLLAPLFHQQLVRRHHGRILRRRRILQYLSAGGGSDRAAVPVLPSRVLQWYFLGGTGRWIDRASHGGLRGR